MGDGDGRADDEMAAVTGGDGEGDDDGDAAEATGSGPNNELRPVVGTGVDAVGGELLG